MHFTIYKNDRAAEFQMIDKKKKKDGDDNN